jgi:TolB-like protein/Tfp pilus assembly protein PilF
MDAMPEHAFQLRLLGRFELAGPHGPIDLASKKLAALVAYLACTGPRPQSRDTLMTLLWGSHFDAQARQNLRQALARLRRILGEGVIAADNETVGLRAGAITTDVARFEALLLEGSRDALDEAVGLYGDSFLADLSIEEESWNEWLVVQRQRLEDVAIDGMIKLGEHELSRGDHTAALRSLNRALALNSTREDAHRLVMQALMAGGRRGDAVKHYDDLTALLRRNLNVEPDAATTRLAAELRSPRDSVQGVAPQLKNPIKAAQRTKPCIAVLPFANLNGDPAEAYFSDAITDDITTALSRWRWFSVIARNLAFAYKGQTGVVSRMGVELGAQYVLEGSVLRSGGRLRITARLNDTLSGVQVWADRFHGVFDDIFELLDRVVVGVVATLEPQLRRAELERIRQKRPENPTAYHYLMQALPHVYAVKPAATAEALRLLSLARRCDPNYAAAHALAAFCLMQRRQQGWGRSPREDEAQGIDLAEKALELDADDPMVLWTAAHAISALGRDHTRARTLIDRSLTLNPNSAEAWCISGWNHNYTGNGLAGLADFQRAIRLSPSDPMRYYFYTGMSSAYMNLQRYDLTVHWAEKALSERPNYGSTLRQLAVGLAYSGKQEGARVAIGRMLKVDPSLTLAAVDRSRSPLSDPEDRLRYLNGLQLAGLPRK